MTLWMVGSVPVTVRRKLSHVEVVQSAATGSEVDSVKGPPSQVALGLAGDIDPLEGVAACAVEMLTGALMMQTTRGRRSGARWRVDMGNLSSWEKNADCRCAEW